MKRIICLFLILLMLVAFSSCSDKLQGNEDLSFDEKLLDCQNEERTLTEISKDTNLIAPAKDAENELYGYIDLAGQWVCEPNYSKTISFAGDHAMVLDNYSEYLIVDRQFETVLSLFDRKPINEVSHFSCGNIKISLDLGINQKYVYLNENMAAAFSASAFPKVKGNTYSNNNYFALATPFVDGRALVMRERNSNLTKKNQEESAYIVGLNGDILATLPAGLDPDEDGFDENMNIIVHDKNNLYGLCDKNANQLVECKYRRLLHCDGKLYLACNENGFWGYIDEAENTIIDFQYQKAMPFSEGCAAVFDGVFWGFINEKGEYVTESIFDEIAALKFNCDDSAAARGAYCEGVAAVKYNGDWVLLDESFNPLFCIKAEEICDSSVCPFINVRNGYLVFTEAVDGNDLCGVTTTEGQLVIEPKFKDIGTFN